MRISKQPIEKTTTTQGKADDPDMAIWVVNT